MTARLHRWLIAMGLGLALGVAGTPSLRPAFAAGGKPVTTYVANSGEHYGTHPCQCGW
jgi:hypothetical protein